MELNEMTAKNKVGLGVKQPPTSGALVALSLRGPD